jgi:predicted  nucleic acid-binding Zn-ribbon protein
MAHRGKAKPLMNPFDALLVPPALVKRAFDDLHDIATLARSYAGLEAELRDRVEHIEDQFDALLVEIRAMRLAVEPLEQSMVAVRDSVDELEPMISDLDAKIRRIEPKLDEMHDSVEPIGDLAEKIPGNRRRR